MGCGVFRINQEKVTLSRRKMSTKLLAALNLLPRTFLSRKKLTSLLPRINILKVKLPLVKVSR